MSQLQLDLLHVDSEPLPMLQRLGELSTLATAPDDYRRI